DFFSAAALAPDAGFDLALDDAGDFLAAVDFFSVAPDGDSLACDASTRASRFVDVAAGVFTRAPFVPSSSASTRSAALVSRAASTVSALDDAVSSDVLTSVSAV